MAVTRHVRLIYLPGTPFDVAAADRFQQELNKALGSSERIVHMEHEDNSQSKWIVVTEELVMGPTK